MYIHQIDLWPEFTWDPGVLASLLAEVRHKQGLLLGRMSGLGFDLRNEANLNVLTADVVKSSAIEGEVLDSHQVRSSIARRLGVDIGGTAPVRRDIEGIVDMMLDATQNYKDALTKDRLFGWHSALFPTGRSGLHKINVGKWRTTKSGVMQVISGAYGRETIHFEAPHANRLAKEMRVFLSWFNQEVTTDPVIKAAIAHLWFVTIHPFEDGNGRIGRAIADMALARSDNNAQRFYSMSAYIEKERDAYYRCLETTQRGGMDITPWLEWFLICLKRAIESAEDITSHVIYKAKLWDRLNQHPVQERQRKIINMLIDGFEGKLTTSKYAKIAKCSQDTALRDIRELMEWNVLIQSPEGGRSTSYTLVED